MKATRLFASGEQVELSAGDTRLTVVTEGGGMRELIHGDWAVLDGYAVDEVPPGASGQPLIPWPNRLADSKYEFDGHTYQVPLTEPDKRNALHGFARWMTWRVESHEPSQATLGLDLYPRGGYPFALRVEVTYTVRPGRVDVAVEAMNAGAARLPYANGFHPYISAGTPLIDDCALHIPAETWLRTDERQIPVGRRDVASTAYDFRTARTIGDARLDMAFTDLTRDADGLARVLLRSPDGRRSVAVWMDAAYGYIMAFTGDTLGDVPRRRRAIAIEPMTAAPNAFQSGEGLRILDPGQTCLSKWGIEIAGA